MDMDRFRQRLCECRATLVGSQAELSVLTKTEEHPVAISAMTISAIERGASANPGIQTIVRLVEAMPGLTLSSFFARIEVLSDAAEAGKDQPPQPILVSRADETVSTLTAEELHTIRALTKVIRADADREHEEAQGQRRSDHRHAADPSRQQKTAPYPKTRSSRQRAAQRRQRNKKIKRTR